MIEVHELSKSYRGKVVVDGLSFTVQPGRVTGFLGPNGAGKSTTMRLIVGLDHPSNGSATIGGRPYAELSRPLRVIGALLDAESVHPGRSAYNHLLFLAQSQGITRRRVHEVLDVVGLHDVATDRTGTFSLGMRQRLGIAVALLGDPQVLILDEPINGLDPDGIFWIRNLLKDLAGEGRTVFVSSHLMGEMAVTADNLIVIGRGRLIADCTTEEFIENSSHKSVLVKSADSGRLRAALVLAGGQISSDADGGLVVRSLDARHIGELAARAGIALWELSPRLASLEEAFRGRTFWEPGMTTTLAPIRTPPSAVAGRGETALDLVRSEWTKICSLRSTVWSLLLLVVVTLGFTALFTALTVAQWATIAPTTKSQVLADPGRMVLGAGFQLGQLAICVLGVLVVTGEYSSGTIRASLLAVPTRTPMLAAKAAVFAVLTFVVGELTAIPTFFLGAAILNSRAPVSITDPGVLRAVIGAGMYLAVLAIFAIAIGALVRHTAGAITGIIGFVLVLSPLTQLIPGSVGNHIHDYLPSEAGSLIASPRQGIGDLLGPWQGFGVMCLETAMLIVAAAYLLRRRDA